MFGYLIQFNGTEEWLHLGYNVIYLLALYALIIPLWRITPAVLPARRVLVLSCRERVDRVFHMVEHGVIIRNVIANGGCPCPGIGDRALNVSDTVLHFFYNLIAYAGIVLAYGYVLRDHQSAALAGRHAALETIGP